jgi:putative MFS transporter
VNVSATAYVGHALDDLRLGKFHARVIALITAGLFFDLFDVAILGSLAPDLVATKFATPANIAIIASATFMGLLFGSVLQGEFTDRFGRKAVYQINLLLYGVATLAAAAAPDYLVLAALRFVAGLGLGAEIPLAYAYAAEFVPKRSRGTTLALVNLIGGTAPFPIAVLMVLLFRGSVGWRGIFAVIGIGALVVFVLRFSLPESPRWLAAKGRVQQALTILGGMGVTDIPASFNPAPDPEAHFDPLWLIFSRYTRRVLGLMTALFCSFMALYALVTWLPTLMGNQGFTITKSLTFTLVMTTAFPISSIVLMMVLDRLGRIRTAIGAFVLAGISALLFSASGGETMLLVTGFLMSFFVVSAANTLDVLCGEIFPTSARSSGSGLCFGAGRLGAVLASYVVLGTLSTYGTDGVFVVIAIILAAGAISTAILGTEPAGLSLEDVVSHDQGGGILPSAGASLPETQA